MSTENYTTREGVKMLQCEALKKRKVLSKKMQFVTDALIVLGAVGATAGWIAFCEHYVNPRTEVANKERNLQSAVVSLIDDCSETELNNFYLKTVYINKNDKTLVLTGVGENYESTYNIKAKVAVDDETFAELDNITYLANNNYFDLTKTRDSWNLSSYSNFITALNNAVTDEDSAVVAYDEVFKGVSMLLY